MRTDETLINVFTNLTTHQHHVEIKLHNEETHKTQSKMDELQESVIRSNNESCDQNLSGNEN